MPFQDELSRDLKRILDRPIPKPSRAKVSTPPTPAVTKPTGRGGARSILTELALGTVKGLLGIPVFLAEHARPQSVAEIERLAKEGGLAAVLGGKLPAAFERFYEEEVRKPALERLGYRERPTAYSIGEWLGPTALTTPIGAAVTRAPQVAQLISKVPTGVGKLGAVAATRAAVEAPLAWSIVEAPKPPEEREPLPATLAYWAAGEAGTRLLGALAKRALARARGKEAKGVLEEALSELTEAERRAAAPTAPEVRTGAVAGELLALPPAREVPTGAAKGAKAVSPKKPPAEKAPAAPAMVKDPTLVNIKAVAASIGLGEGDVLSIARHRYNVDALTSLTARQAYELAGLLRDVRGAVTAVRSLARKDPTSAAVLMREAFESLGGLEPRRVVEVTGELMPKPKVQPRGAKATVTAPGAPPATPEAPRRPLEQMTQKQRNAVYALGKAIGLEPQDVDELLAQRGITTRADADALQAELKALTQTVSGLRELTGDALRTHLYNIYTRTLGMPPETAILRAAAEAAKVEQQRVATTTLPKKVKGTTTSPRTTTAKGVTFEIKPHYSSSLRERGVSTVWATYGDRPAIAIADVEAGNLGSLNFDELADKVISYWARRDAAEQLAEWVAKRHKGASVTIDAVTRDVVVTDKSGRVTIYFVADGKVRALTIPEPGGSMVVGGKPYKVVEFVEGPNNLVVVDELGNREVFHVEDLRELAEVVSTEGSGKTKGAKAKVLSTAKAETPKTLPKAAGVSFITRNKTVSVPEDALNKALAKGGWADDMAAIRETFEAARMATATELGVPVEKVDIVPNGRLVSAFAEKVGKSNASKLWYGLVARAARDGHLPADDLAFSASRRATGVVYVTDATGREWQVGALGRRVPATQEPTTIRKKPSTRKKAVVKPTEDFDELMDRVTAAFYEVKRDKKLQEAAFKDKDFRNAVVAFNRAVAALRNAPDDDLLRGTVAAHARAVLDAYAKLPGAPIVVRESPARYTPRVGALYKDLEVLESGAPRGTYNRMAAEAVGDLAEGRQKGDLPISEAPGARWDTDRRIGERRIIAQALADELSSRGQVDLRGKIVRRPEDLAVHAQVLRDPRFETLRFFVLKGGVIVDEVAVTSRLPGMVHLTEDEARKLAKEIVDLIEFRDADSVYLLHNHPSGYAKPSPEDMQAVKRVRALLGKHGDKLKGQVVIDDLHYGFTDGSSWRTDRLPRAAIDVQTAQMYKWFTFPVPHKLLGKSILNESDMADVGHMLVRRADGNVVVSFCTSTGTIRRIAEVGAEDLLDTEAFGRYVREVASKHGTEVIYVHVPVTGRQERRAFENELLHAAIRAYRRGIIRDAAFGRPREWRSKQVTLGELVEAGRIKPPSETEYLGLQVSGVSGIRVREELIPNLRGVPADAEERQAKLFSNPKTRPTFRRYTEIDPASNVWSIPTKDLERLPADLRARLMEIDNKIANLMGRGKDLLFARRATSLLDLSDEDRLTLERIARQIEKALDARERIRPQVEEALGEMAKGRFAASEVLPRLTDEKLMKDVQWVKDPSGRTIMGFYKIGGQEIAVPPTPELTTADEALLTKPATLYSAWLTSMQSLFGEAVMRPVRNASRMYQHFLDQYGRRIRDIMKPVMKDKEARKRVTYMLEGRMPLEGVEGEVAKRLRAEIYDPLFEIFGIDPEKYLKNYSPRVRKLGSFAEAMRVGGRDIPKGLRFFAEMERRGLLMPRETDAYALAIIYTRLGAKKKFFDPLLKEMRPVTERMHPSKKVIFANMINHMIGRPVEQEALAESLLRAVANELREVLNLPENVRILGHEAPRVANRPTIAVSRFLTQMGYLYALGGNIMSTLKNITQQVLAIGLLDGNPARGMAYWLKAHDALLTPTGRKLLRYCWVYQHRTFLEGLEAQSTFMRRLMQPLTRAGLYTYELADKYNVAVSYTMRLLYDLERGKPLAEAIDAANAFAGHTQFLYGIDSPMLYKTPIGRVLGMLMSWPLRFMELMYQQFKGRGHDPAWAAKIGSTLFGMTVLTYGLTKLTGLDFTRETPLGQLEGWLPVAFALGVAGGGDWAPTWPPAVEAVTGVASGAYRAARGKLVDDPALLDEAKKDLWRSFGKLVPFGVVGARTRKFVEAALNDWKVYDDYGRLQRKVTPGEAWRWLIGPTEESRRWREELQRYSRAKDVYRNLRAHARQAFLEGDWTALAKYNNELVKRGFPPVDADDYRRWLREAGRTSLERARVGLPEGYEPEEPSVLEYELRRALGGS